jgi:hypothetical protein
MDIKSMIYGMVELLKVLYKDHGFGNTFTEVTGNLQLRYYRNLISSKN